ncbi:MAG: LCP family protein [Clostridia bacterium]
MKKKNGYLKKIFLVIFIVIIGIGIYGGFQFWSFIDNVYNEPNIMLEEELLENEPINLLFLGIDSNPGRSDTIVLVSYNPSTEKLLGISIPRDTIVDIPGYYRNTENPYGEQRINHAHAYGGIPLTVKTVENFLGINIHYHARVDYSVLHNFVDLIGGVPLNVPYDMNYTDEAGDLYINLKEGEQTLDGDKAEQFLRWRKNSDGSGDGLGDIGRVQRQQMFIKAAIKQLMKPTNLLKVNKIEELVSDKVVTNVPPSNMVGWFKDFAIGFDFDENFEMMTVPGDYSNSGSFWVVSDSDRDQLNKIIQDHLMPGIESEISIKVYNSTGNNDIVEKTIDRLNKYSFINASFAGDYEKELPLTEVVSYTENNIAKYVASIVHAQNNVYVGNNNDDADIVIIIGSDLVI